MQIVIEFFNSLLELSYAMAPYILFGLLFAGILHTFLPTDYIKNHLGKDSTSSVIKATLFGIPLPVCSCGVIPLASSIKKSGASKGATLSFLISTPITGVDSILATYGIFGFLFTIYRIVTSVIVAIIAGILTNIFDSDKAKSVKFQKVNNFNILKSEEKSSSCCSGGSCCDDKKNSHDDVISKIKEIFNYGFITLFSDIAKALFWGLIIGALISVLVPKDLSVILSEYNFLSYIIVLAIALPMYVCATASLPIAASLLLSGVSVGAAFVFLSAGPATNTVTMGVVKDMLGKKALSIYLATIAIFSILFGLFLDFIFSSYDISSSSIINISEDISNISIFSAVVMWGFLIYFFIKSFFKKSSCKDGCCS